MKKATSILLVLIMVLSLCACGASNEQLKRELCKDQWYASLEYSSVHFMFGYESKVSYGFSYGGGIKPVGAKGTYVIKDNEIIITNEVGNTIFLKYTYTDGELQLIYNDDGQDVILKHGKYY